MLYCRRDPHLVPVDLPLRLLGRFISGDLADSPPRGGTHTDDVCDLFCTEPSGRSHSANPTGIAGGIPDRSLAITGQCADLVEFVAGHMAPRRPACAGFCDCRRAGTHDRAKWDFL